MTAYLLLTLTALLIGVGTTGLHIHHEDHAISESAHTASSEQAEDNHCAAHCVGEPLLEHFLENHGSLFNKISRAIQFTPALMALPEVLLLREPPAQPHALKASEKHISLYLAGPLSERAPPFFA